jgi:hypothetical protein
MDFTHEKLTSSSEEERKNGFWQIRPEVKNGFRVDFDCCCVSTPVITCVLVAGCWNAEAEKDAKIENSTQQCKIE